MLNISPNRVFIAEDSENLYVFKLLRTPPAGKIVARWMLGIIVIFLAAMFLPWQQNIRGYGSLSALTPADRPQKVYTVVPGQISEWYVAEGNMVKKGDPLVKITEVKDYFFDPKLLSRLNEQFNAQTRGIDALGNKVSALNTQGRVLDEGMRLSIAQAENKVSQLAFKIKIDSADLEAVRVAQKNASMQYEREKELFAKGLTPRIELENKTLKAQEAAAKLNAAENKLSTTRNEYINTMLDISAKRAEYMDKIAKSQSELSSTEAYITENQGKALKMQTEIANLEARQDFYVIRAPQDGIVIKSMKAGIGEVIKEGEVLLTVMPSDPRLAVELYVQANDLPLLQVGTPVRLQFDGWPALVFSGWDGASLGTFGGKIAVIDNVNTYENKYRILVVEDTARETDVPWPKKLRVGSGVYGWAMLNEVSVWFELWRQLNAFPPLMENLGLDKEGNKKYGDSLKDSKEKEAKKE
ncbi:MAG: HlyD family efflux transporter periplasmic adaptor subunit [Cytophagales bacterium]|nr:MAG: HlyD family efflux transporter periplasmic adaptor subunit [Cytophagales bacterium]TAF60786.1 MAG: HlyD family efflux transporter periplasmic adaptor subunit [Cytophagales bacterium]